MKNTIRLLTFLALVVLGVLFTSPAEITKAATNKDGDTVDIATEFQNDDSYVYFCVTEQGWMVHNNSMNNILLSEQEAREHFERVHIVFLHIQYTVTQEQQNLITTYIGKIDSVCFDGNNECSTSLTLDFSSFPNKSLAQLIDIAAENMDVNLTVISSERLGRLWVCRARSVTYQGAKILNLSLHEQDPFGMDFPLRANTATVTINSDIEELHIYGATVTGKNPYMGSLTVTKNIITGYVYESVFVNDAVGSFDVSAIKLKNVSGLIYDNGVTLAPHTSTPVNPTDGNAFIYSVSYDDSSFWSYDIMLNEEYDLGNAQKHIIVENANFTPTDLGENITFRSLRINTNDHNKTFDIHGNYEDVFVENGNVNFTSGKITSLYVQNSTIKSYSTVSNVTINANVSNLVMYGNLIGTSIKTGPDGNVSSGCLELAKVVTTNAITEAYPARFFSAVANSTIIQNGKMEIAINCGDSMAAILPSTNEITASTGLGQDWITTIGITDQNITATESSSVASFLNSEYTDKLVGEIVDAIDINVHAVQYNKAGEIISQKDVSNLNKPVEIVLDIPAAISEESYELIRIHNSNGTTQLDIVGSSAGETLTAKTNKFSKYVLVRLKKNNQPQPTTTEINTTEVATTETMITENGTTESATTESTTTENTTAENTTTESTVAENVTTENMTTKSENNSADSPKNPTVKIVIISVSVLFIIGIGVTAYILIKKRNKKAHNS